MNEYKNKLIEMYHENLNILHEGLREGNYDKRNKAVKSLKKILIELSLIGEITEKTVKSGIKILKDLKVGEDKFINIIDELESKLRGRF
jgi:hypothetical protein